MTISKQNNDQFKAGLLAMGGMAALIVTLGSASAVYAKKMTGADLSNLIIQGENRLQVHPSIPAVDWVPVIYKDVATILLNHNVIKDMQPPAIERPAVQYPEKLSSAKTASPWLNQIFEAPVLTLTFKTSPGKDKKSDYTFLVKDSDGKVFYSLKKKGLLPSEMQWDGIGNEGKPIRSGFDYTYMFSTIDEAGNPQRMAGKPFKIDAFRYPQGGRTVTAFYPEALFDNRSSIKLSQEGINYLTELKDYFRSRFGNKIDVVLYEDDEKFGLARANVVIDFLAKNLNLSADRIEVQVLRTSNGGGYRHVDIVSK